MDQMCPDALRREITWITSLIQTCITCASKICSKVTPAAQIHQQILLLTLTLSVRNSSNHRETKLRQPARLRTKVAKNGLELSTKAQTLPAEGHCEQRKCQLHPRCMRFVPRDGGTVWLGLGRFPCICTWAQLLRFFTKMISSRHMNVVPTASRNVTDEINDKKCWFSLYLNEKRLLRWAPKTVVFLYYWKIITKNKR